MELERISRVTSETYFSLSTCLRLPFHIFFPFFLGDFAKLLKATLSFVMSVCLFVRMEQLSYKWIFMIPDI
jgi:glycopeptide antibiotics resistance protein